MPQQNWDQKQQEVPQQQYQQQVYQEVPEQQQPLQAAPVPDQLYQPVQQVEMPSEDLQGLKGTKIENYGSNIINANTNSIVTQQQIQGIGDSIAP